MDQNDCFLRLFPGISASVAFSKKYEAFAKITVLKPQAKGLSPLETHNEYNLL